MFNIPNILSALRIVVAITAPFFLIDGSLWVRLAVGALCTIAVATDFIDGWYARKYNKITTLGKILDPIADKALVLICFSVFVYLDVLSIWWVIPIFIREIVVTIYRFIFLSRNVVVAAVKSGKIKTIMQMGTLAILYIWFMINKHYKDFDSDFWDVIVYASLAITLYLTISSGYIFFKNNWKLIKGYHEIA